MSSYGLDLLVEQLPLILGIVLFGFLIKFNPYARHFVVQHNRSPAFKPPSPEVTEKEEGMENYLRDQLVINGIQVGRAEATNLRSRAFHSLGMVEAPLAGSYLLKCRDKPEKISLLSSNPGQITNLLTEKSRISGLLLAYQLESKLGAIVV